AGPDRAPIRWRIASGDGSALQRGVAQPIGLSTRLRLSLWTFNAAFIQKVDGSQVILDPARVTLLQAARIDDLSLVRTITFDDSNNKVKGSGGYAPGGSPQLRAPYLAELIRVLHGIGVQVLVGYEIVAAGANRSEVGASFTRWLGGADDEQIRGHA